MPPNPDFNSDKEKGEHIYEEIKESKPKMTREQFLFERQINSFEAKFKLVNEKMEKLKSKTLACHIVTAM